jgi:ankyrin repeat protein
MPDDLSVAVGEKNGGLKLWQRAGSTLVTSVQAHQNLISASADVSARDHRGNSPLLIAAKAGRDEIVRLLNTVTAEPSAAGH